MPSFARLLDCGCWTAVAGHRLRTHPYRQLLPEANFSTSRAQNRHFCALLPASFFPMAPPASNKPHSAEKSTPLRLAIWRIWAGFANSQLRYATIRSTYSYICTHPPCCTLRRCSDRRKSFGPSAPIAYATSVSPPNEAAAWPGGAGVGWQMLLLVVRGTVPANHRARFQNANTS